MKLKFLLPLFLVAVMTNAQILPVQSTVQLIPPYSLRLSDYSTASLDRIYLNLLLIDVVEPTIQVRLKMYIENSYGISIQSKDFVTGATPIVLEGGVPKRLGNIDLRSYFELNNLQGISADRYSRLLPEGLYKICFEVFDNNSGRKVSRKDCTTVYLVLNDPPLLNLPSRGEHVVMRNPQNIFFTWTPRHLNATNVLYYFELKELWDSNLDPQTNFYKSPSLFTTTTNANALLYGPGQTQLLPNKLYGWRVKATVNDGISKTSNFKNDGYSEIYYFTYVDTCEEPMYVLAKSAGITKETIIWEISEHQNYRVQYRKKGSNNDWFDGETSSNSVTIYDLEPGTTYEYRVGGQCIKNGPFVYSQIYQFTTDIVSSSEVVSEYNCGIPPKINIENQELLASLDLSKGFKAGDFDVTLNEVSGSNGLYSGKGYILVPYMRNARIAVDFVNIKINTDYQLIDGIVNTIESK
ncbi:fibronectin type III domain-containing protein [Aquimarina sp. W85]|uniref:fibronectin type III domain-containing protein n=1 Tax=Aquimarina rhodophyticola TaxID=3342246 RepID=UPI00366DDEE7